MAIPPQKTSTARDLKADYAAALTAMQAGKLPQALEMFGAIHALNPRIAEVEYQIARLLIAMDRFDRAMPHAAAAVALAPAQAAVWATLADAVALDGSPAARDELLRQLKSSTLDPARKLALADRFGAAARTTRPPTGGVAPQILAQLVALDAAGKYKDAEVLAARTLKSSPGCAVAAVVAGSALAAQGKAEPALAAFRAALAVFPGYAEAQANMAPVLASLGRAEEARSAWRAAIALAPEHLPALMGFAAHLRSQGKELLAVKFLSRAAAVAPDRADVLHALGNVQTSLRDHAAAYETFRKATRLPGRKTALPLMMLAQSAAHLGRDDEAERVFREALALDPGNPVIRGAFGVFLQGIGRFDAGEAEFLAAIKSRPDEGEPYRLFYASHKARAGEPMIAEMQRRAADPSTPEASRRSFSFAIAKALEDIGDHQAAFEHLVTANALMRKAFPYDIRDREKQIDLLVKALDGMDWGNRIEGATEAAPIFVTGMPRSGTTLVEQIISSHSRVTGAGELADSTVSAMRLMPQVAPDQLRPARQIPLPEIAGLGHDYAAMMRARFPQTPQITDKSIQTYLTIGLMHLAMPNARFIVVRRDPRDTLLSIFKNVFPEGTHLYAYDQVDLARHYATFVRMIDFWRIRLPGAFHEIHYEALVSDPEAQSRALIEACGLPWEDACLNFHQNDRKVETLSVWQVRQPISRKSVRAWERYGDGLSPMIAQLKKDGFIGDQDVAENHP